MENLLVMAISGSVMTCMYLLTRGILRERLCARVYYLAAKAAVLYYMIPLPFLKGWYREIIPAGMWQRRMESDRVPLMWTNYAVHVESDSYRNIFAAVQTVAAVIWIAGAGILILRKLIAYLRTTRYYSKYAETTMTEGQRELIDRLKKEYGVKRRVTLLQAREGDPTFTFGIFSPVIIFAKDTDSREGDLLIRHEMIHIRRLDVLWKILAECVTVLHWWNVFAWILRERVERISECACDETVVKGKTREEISDYMVLLIEEGGNEKTRQLVADWKAGFGGGAKHIRERMENIMDHKRWNRVAAGALMLTLIFANSMTVFAYRDTFHETIGADASEEEIDRLLNNDTAVFVPGSEEIGENLTLGPMVEILYESQFADEEGNVYPAFEDEGIEPYCNHVFVAGRLQEHGKTSGGGCEVREYYANRCAKCGWVIRGDLIATYTWVTCPH